jgi:effector-binding domain-containing protein
MKNLKWVGITALVLILLFLILAFLLPSQYNVTRSTIIKQPPDYCFQGVVNMQYRKQWDPWLDKEKQKDVYIEVTPQYTGSIYRWNGDTIGSGKMVIDSIVPFEHIYSTLTFIKPQEMLAHVVWHFEKHPEGTKATWQISGELNYPLERWFGLFIENALGKDFETGLNNLERFLEQKNLLAWLELVHTGKTSEDKFVGIYKELKGPGLQKKIAEVFAELSEEMNKQNIAYQMPPRTIYHSYAMDNTAKISATYPYAGDTSALKRPLKAISIKKGRALIGIHRGGYNNLAYSYSLLNQYATEHKLPITGIAYEVYITNPAKTKDTANWQTQIIYPLIIEE